jgi:hypothetical protein
MKFARGALVALWNEAQSRISVVLLERLGQSTAQDDEFTAHRHWTDLKLATLIAEFSGSRSIGKVGFKTAVGLPDRGARLPPPPQLRQAG